MSFPKISPISVQRKCWNAMLWVFPSSETRQQLWSLFPLRFPSSRAGLGSGEQPLAMPPGWAAITPLCSSQKWPISLSEILVKHVV